MTSESKKDDFSGLLSEGIAAAQQLVENGDFNGAIEKLLGVEKRTRTAGDGIATAKAAVAVIQLCVARGDFDALLANLLLISKRRGQLKQAISDMVTEAIKYLESVTDKEQRIQLITTLRTITDGKIYVEVERARLTRMLAEIYEADGKVNEASEILQEVAVETYGSMEKREKADFILEQVRLTRAQKDFSRMGILANKINKRILDEAGFEDLRIRFYELLISLHQHQRNAMALCKDYQAIYATRGFSEDASKWGPALQSVIVYLSLAPYSNEVSDLLHRLKTDKKTEELPSYRALLDLLTTDELISWPLPEPHHEQLLSHPAFHMPAPEAESGDISMTGGSSAATGISSTGGIKVGIVRKEDEERVSWADIFHKRIVQHNIRVISTWYSRARVDRLCTLLGLDGPTTEAAISELAADKAIYAKIDRPAGVAVFARPRPATEVLSDFTSDLDTVMGLVEKTGHLIEKEYMVHGIGRATAKA